MGLNLDWVTIGSIIAVVICVVIIVYLGFKIKVLMDRDAEAHKKQ